MDFASLTADENRWLGTHYTSGRAGSPIRHVVVHYMGGDLDGAGCYGVWQTRPASAHYAVASTGRITQLVRDRDMAWHCGNKAENRRSIGVEHANRGGNPGYLTDACMASGSHLVAALCACYGLGRPAWGRNLFGHSDFASTDCPGPLRVGMPQHDRYVRMCQQWYDYMTGAGSAPGSEDDLPTPNDVWAFTNDGQQEDTVPGSAWTNLLDTNRRLQQLQADIGSDGTHRVLDNVVDTNLRLQELQTTISAQAEAIRTLASAQGADPEAVAKAVSDAVAAKLAEIRLEVTTS